MTAEPKDYPTFHKESLEDLKHFELTAFCRCSLIHVLNVVPYLCISQHTQLSDIIYTLIKTDTINDLCNIHYSSFDVLCYLIA